MNQARPYFYPFRWPLYVRVLVGVGVGIVLGTLLGKEAPGGPPTWGAGVLAALGELGVLVIRLLKALAAPLILFAVLDSLVKIRLTASAGFRLVAICLFNVTVAFAIGLTIMNTLRPGDAWRGRIEAMTATLQAPGGENSDAKKLAAPGVTLSPLKNLNDYIPVSLVDPLVKNSVISLVLIGLLAGISLRYARDRAEPEQRESLVTIERFIEGMYLLLMQMLMLAVQLVPLAVFGAVAKVVGESGLGVFRLLWIFLATMLLGLGIHALIYYPLAAWLAGGRSPRVYLGRGMDAILTSLSMNSSLATVPITLKCLTERMGVSQHAARLSACLGTNLNNDGIVLYDAMAALFLAQALGFELTLWQQMGVCLASIMAGVGISGIPEAGLIVLPLVLAAAGLSDKTVVAALPLIMPVDWIIARCRSGVNTMSDMLVAILLDRTGPLEAPEPECSEPAQDFL